MVLQLSDLPVALLPTRRLPHFHKRSDRHLTDVRQGPLKPPVTQEPLDSPEMRVPKFVVGKQTVDGLVALPANDSNLHISLSACLKVVALHQTGWTETVTQGAWGLVSPLR